MTTTHAPTFDASGGLFSAILTSSLTMKCLVIAAVLLVLLGVVLRASLRLKPLAAQSRALGADAAGTTTIEFAMLLPILLFIALSLAQVTFLMGGNIFVHYSAYAAARSAVVQIPAEYPDLPANHYVKADGSSKYDAIRRTAALALIPAAGEGDGPYPSNVNAAPIVAALAAHYTAQGMTPPRWIEAFMAERINYAVTNTDVDLFVPEVVDSVTVIPREVTGEKLNQRDPITVRVTHRLDLPIPYANRIFADGVQGDGLGRYTIIQASATLVNHGITPEMHEPELPRIP